MGGMVMILCSLEKHLIKKAWSNDKNGKFMLMSIALVILIAIVMVIIFCYSAAWKVAVDMWGLGGVSKLFPVAMLILGLVVIDFSFEVMFYSIFVVVDSWFLSDTLFGVGEITLKYLYENDGETGEQYGLGVNINGGYGWIFVSQEFFNQIKEWEKVKVFYQQGRYSKEPYICKIV